MGYRLSTDQAAALKAIGLWYRTKSKPYLTLGGYAGTGKTSLIAYLRKALAREDDSARVAFCAFTGKATRVLTERLREQRVPKRRDSISTIHSLIYSTEETPDGRPLWRRKADLDRDLIIVDEASMVDETIWGDLLSFGVPVLAVGDHGQLPPVGSSFNLMAEPELKLEQIFRQANDSPIITVATQARQSGRIEAADYGDGVRKLSRQTYEAGEAIQELIDSWTPERMVLCGYNTSRVRLNQAVRQAQGYDLPTPQPGDRVVCLRNNRTAKIYNGMTGTIRSLAEVDKDWYEATVSLDLEDYDYSGFIARSQFGVETTIKDRLMAPNGQLGDLFDFGYALTVHKAQGSQATEVLLFEERFPKSSDDDWRRWLYTGVTRATERLTIIGN